jgi:hypothetical protein
MDRGDLQRACAISPDLHICVVTLLLRVRESFGCCIILHSARSAWLTVLEEDLFVFDDTIEGPRAPAVKPGRVTPDR